MRRPASSAPAAATRPSWPLRTSSSAAASRTLRAIGPGESWLWLMGTTPRVGTEPTVGLMPTRPFSELGHTIEPSVSVPTAIGANPAATAAPDPEEEPPALRSSAHGLPVSPRTADQPLEECGLRMFAHSERFVAPMMMAPASRILCAIGESTVTVRSARLVAPAVPGRPTASMLSLIRTGTPCSGPRLCPCARSASRSRATASAPASTARTERSEMSVPSVSMAAMRSSSAPTSATLVVPPDASSDAAAAASRFATCSLCGCGSAGWVR